MARIPIAFGRSIGPALERERGEAEIRLMQIPSHSFLGTYVDRSGGQNEPLWKGSQKNQQEGEGLKDLLEESS